MVLLRLSVPAAVRYTLIHNALRTLCEEVFAIKSTWEDTMKKCLLPLLLVFISLGAASWSVGQDFDESACQQIITASCTKCHTTDRICNELGAPTAHWAAVVKQMGMKGKLSQDVQDSVLNCLTKASEPGKFVCKK